MESIAPYLSENFAIGSSGRSSILGNDWKLKSFETNGTRLLISRVVAAMNRSLRTLDWGVVGLKSVSSITDAWG